ncbi:hypothetical protein [Geoalkalibacter halelectricus]|uniref:Uncharacterized protein n=1 Tax=Geoalkalibacter halelectricus TaxID=2847045 RepID=A0ABY5ZMJ5_9BACT|nr:hypothetical protein [Geoalkalibacter halelectricus]MDO3380126.1 hypothetical protein [Geoalkalibacter halelectricus]UWZ80355.1 hypothetical protein L9S41_02870 [Geoalkalibacter halelectricus]
MRIHYGFRSFRASLFGFILFFILGSASYAGELVYPPECEEPGCLRTAQMTDWPSSPQESVFTMELHRFSLALPSQPKRVARQWGGDVFVAGQDNSLFVFSLVTTYGGVEGVPMPQKSNFSVADSGRFIFTKTVEDSRPEDPNDLWIWLWAIDEKQMFFGKDNPVYTATKGSLTVYFWEDIRSKDSARAFIFDSESPECYVRVHARDITFDEFKKIVGSVTMK